MEMDDSHFMISLVLVWIATFALNVSVSTKASPTKSEVTCGVKMFNQSEIKEIEERLEWIDVIELEDDGDIVLLKTERFACNAYKVYTKDIRSGLFVKGGGTELTSISIHIHSFYHFVISWAQIPALMTKHKNY